MNISGIEKFINKNKEEIVKEYQWLIGLSVVKFLSTSVFYYVIGEIELSNGEVIDCYFRWCTEEEESEERELIGSEGIAEEMTMMEYFNKYIVGKEIIKLDLEETRVDEIFLTAYVDDEHFIEISVFDVNADDIDINGEVINY